MYVGKASNANPTSSYPPCYASMAWGPTIFICEMSVWCWEALWLADTWIDTCELESMVWYAGQLLDPATGFRRGYFCHLGQKRLIILLLPILGHLWCSLVPLVNVGSNLNYFKIKKEKTVSVSVLTRALQPTPFQNPGEYPEREELSPDKFLILCFY